MDNLYLSKINDIHECNADDPTKNIKGYQMMTSRMKKGREDREKI